jgi:hypothetical protein
MSRLVLAGLSLIAAAAVCSIGSLIDSPRNSSVAWALGACIAFAGAAAGYRATAGTGRPSAVPAAALALMGVVASAWIVEATLRLAHVRPDSLRFIAVLCSGVGLALLAGAASGAGLVRPAVSRVIAVSSMVGALTADPAVSYLIGGAPLGVALLAAAAGTRARGVREVRMKHAPGGAEGDRAGEAVERRGRANLMSFSVVFGAGLAAAMSTGGTR